MLCILCRLMPWIICIEVAFHVSMWSDHRWLPSRSPSSGRSFYFQAVQMNIKLSCIIRKAYNVLVYGNFQNIFKTWIISSQEMYLVVVSISITVSCNDKSIIKDLRDSWIRRWIWFDKKCAPPPPTYILGYNGCYLFKCVVLCRIIWNQKLI